MKRGIIFQPVMSHFHTNRFKTASTVTLIESPLTEK